MEEKMFTSDNNLEEIENIINKYMENGILDFQNDKLIEKWNYFSVIDLESDEIKNKLLEIIKYIDEVVEIKGDKISCILTLVYLVVKEKLNIVSINENSIFLIINYVNKVDINNISNVLPIIANNELLTAVRLKTLDIDIRIELLDYLVKKYSNINDMISFIENNEYYDMLDAIRN